MKNDKPLALTGLLCNQHRSEESAVIGSCPLGTDINDQDFLIAKELGTEKKIAQYISAESLEYLSVEEFGLCLGCTTGNYPVSSFQAKK